MLHISLKTEKSFIAHPWRLLCVEYSAHDWRDATSGTARSSYLARVGPVSQITSLTIVYSTVYSGADQRKHQSSASLAFVWVIHRGPVISPHKWPVTRKMFPFDYGIMSAPDLMFLPTPRKEAITCVHQHEKFTCCAHNFQSLRWYHYDNTSSHTWEEVKLSSHVYHTPEGDNRTLVLERPSLSDGGWYRCTAEDGQGNMISHNILLIMDSMYLFTLFSRKNTKLEHKVLWTPAIAL